MDHVRGAPFYPQAQGKIERRHQTLKKRVPLEDYFLPGDLARQIEAFVEHYNHIRPHSSPGNRTPAEMGAGSNDKHLSKGACLTASSPPKPHQPDETRHSVSQSLSVSRFM